MAAALSEHEGGQELRLTVYTDYSIRVLMYLCEHGEGLATIKDISIHYGISNNHLLKIVHQLGLLGYVYTVRGKNGGIRLGRPADEINIGMVVRQCEQNFNLVQCFEAGEPMCRNACSCTLKTALEKASDAFQAVLNSYTLADLAAPASAAGARPFGLWPSCPP